MMSDDPKGPPNVQSLSLSGSKDPKRYIYTEQDMKYFRASKAKKTLLVFTTALGQSCIPSTSADTKSPYNYDPSCPLKGLTPGMASLHGSLRAMAELWLTDDYFPPNRSSKARFGNPAFREWYNFLTDDKSSIEIVNEILDCHLDFYDIYQTLSLSTSKDDTAMKDNILKQCSDRGYNAATKITHQPKRRQKNAKNPKRQHLLSNLLPYLHSSFGHPTRLDYGTGHESSFLIFLFVLYQMGPLVGTTTTSTTSTSTPSTNAFPASMKLKFPLEEHLKQSLAPIALSILSQYLQVTRSLQTEYMLEPAGSHGVWGLDDYHCLPFYFGACQLIPTTNNNNDDQYTPASIHDPHILKSKASEKLYFGCIRYIKSLKKGVPFGESSPMLNDISHLKSWEKVAKGLLKLYEGEVLDKLQVVQHFVFGDFFPGAE